MSTEHITPLRQRMIEDMNARTASKHGVYGISVFETALAPLRDSRASNHFDRITG
jgi:hypothetical protein